MTPPPTYGLLVCDLRSDQVLERLPVDGLTMDDYIGRTGSASGSIALPTADLAHRVRRSMVPGRTAVYVERGSEIWWGGILWTATPSSDDRGRLSLDWQAATLDSYFDHRRLMDTQVAHGVDQLDIVRQLMDYAQGQPGGDLGIVYDQHTSGVLRDRTYSRYDLPTIRELIDQLSQVQDGFEWRIRCYRDGLGQRVRHLQLGYPAITASATDLVLSKPGDVLSWSWPEDATGRATRWQSRGASINHNQAEESLPLLSTIYYIVGVHEQGWPLLEDTSDYSTVEEQTTLDEHAQADLIRAWGQTTVPTIRVRLGGRISPQLIGSTVRLRIADDWWTPRLDARYRIVGWRLTPTARGQEEAADLYLEAL